MDLGKPAEAAAAYEGALRLDPGNEDAAAGLGAALAGTNRLAEAEEALRRASEAHPASARLWNDLGVVRVRRGQYPGALDAFRRALEVDPGFAAARRNLAGAEQLSALERAAS
jgi:Flp pilus assembly protein TadD